jgi:hypothetical protein
MLVLFEGLTSRFLGSPLVCRSRFAEAVFLKGEAACVYTPKLPPSPVEPRLVLVYRLDDEAGTTFIGEDMSAEYPRVVAALCITGDLKEGVAYLLDRASPSSSCVPNP